MPGLPSAQRVILYLHKNDCPPDLARFAAADGDAPAPITRKLPAGWSKREGTLRTIANEMGYSHSAKLDIPPALQPKLTVVSDEDGPCYDANDSKGLCIAETQTLSDWWCTFIGGIDTKASPVELDGNSIKAAGTTIKLYRTFRVPDDGKAYDLPPGLGTFPLLPVSAYADKLPPEVTAHGGYITPMHQREALWMGFSNSGQSAIKVSVGSINAITGLPKNVAPPDGQQDYLAPLQPWLDGIATEPGVVKQFVACDIDDGYTIEEQLTGQTTGACLQFDIFKKAVPAGLFQHKKIGWSQATKAPKALDIAIGEAINITPGSLIDNSLSMLAALIGKNLSFTERIILPSASAVMIHVKTLTGKTINASVPLNESVDGLKEIIANLEGIPVDQQRLTFKGCQLWDTQLLNDYGIEAGSILYLILRLRGGGGNADSRMGMAAGGRIKQDIYQDTADVDSYAKEPSARVFVHAINAKAWSYVTGQPCPTPPVTRTMYSTYGIPWFTLTNEPKALTELGRGFVNVQSVKEIDEQEQMRPTKRMKVDKGQATEEDFAEQWESGRQGPLVIVNADYVCPPSRA